MKKSVISTVLCVAAIALMPGTAQSQETQQVEKKGTASYVTHFIFRPVETLGISGVGTGQLYEMTGTTQNLKGEPMLDKMAARCTAIRIETGGKKWIDGLCALADKDGDVIMSSFDTRDVDTSDPKLNCGTHSITGGTGKYAGITGREPFACDDMPKLAGGGGYFALDIPHTTTYEIKAKTARK